MAINIKALSEKFDERLVDWVPANKPKIYNGQPGKWHFHAYVDSRAVMDRLDSVVGCENWKDEYEDRGDSFICRLSIRDKESGEWITKVDGAEKGTKENNQYADICKNGITQAFRRAAYKFGIGRYLYDLKDYECIAQFIPHKTKYSKSVKIDNDWFHYLLPELPKQFLPEKDLERRNKNKEEEKKKSVEAAEALDNDPKKVLDDIIVTCKARQIKPSDMRAIIQDKFNVNDSSFLNLEQLKELREFVDGDLK